MRQVVGSLVAAVALAMPAVAAASGPPAAVGQYTEQLPSASGTGATPTPPLTARAQPLELRRLSVGAAIGHALPNAWAFDAAAGVLLVVALALVAERRSGYLRAAARTKTTGIASASATNAKK